jgi:hypothetical protein
MARYAATIDRDPEDSLVDWLGTADTSIANARAESVKRFMSYGLTEWRSDRHILH